MDTATDVAKDAADVVLLEKDLGVLADGVAEGRRIFANTIKYVLMGTSSNFGNMFSAAAASAVLSFLPMLPSQILLNNLLYDSSQLAIPTDRVDDEQLHAPSHWNIAFIRRFMLTFGPISSLFDFVTFGLMLGVLHAGPVEFRTGWFVESLATQTLIIFAIRTRRCRSSAAGPGGVDADDPVAVIAVGVALTVSPLRPRTGFHHAAVAVLHRAGPAHHRLSRPRRGHQKGVLRRSRCMCRTSAPHPRQRAPHPPACRPIQLRRTDRRAGQPDAFATPIVTPSQQEPSPFWPRLGQFGRPAAEAKTRSSLDVASGWLVHSSVTPRAASPAIISDTVQPVPVSAMELANGIRLVKSTKRTRIGDRAHSRPISGVSNVASGKSCCGPKRTSVVLPRWV